jgi:ribosome biogenesis GTPase A
LDINPHFCSGCGSNFQSKSENEPGYLPKEILREHHQRALMMQQRQEAIRLLDLSGIELDSDTAEEVLRSAGKSEEVIRGVRELGKTLAQRRFRKFEATSPAKGAGSQEDSAVDAFDPSINAASNLDDAGNEQDNEGSAEGNVDEHDSDDDEEDDGGREVILDYKENVADSERLHVPSLTDLRKAEDIRGLLPTVSMVREAMARSLLPRKYRSSKYDSTGIYDASTPELLDDLVKQALTHHANETGKDADILLASVGESTGIHTSDDTSSSEAQFKKLSKENAVCICQRCYKLQQYGKVEPSLLPGWSESEALTPKRFVDLLSVVKEKKAVVLCILDIFDLRGSLLQDLRSIAGKNPVVFAVNKVDLLPKDASLHRVKSWVYAEIRHTFGFKTPKELGINPSYHPRSPKEENHKGRDDGEGDVNELMKMLRGDGEGKSTEPHWKKKKNDPLHDADLLRLHDVHLVSCVNKRGVDELMHSVKSLAAEHGNTVYIMGSANVGKSSFVNMLLEQKYSLHKGGKASSFAKDRSRRDGTPKATVSPIPGTTLDFLKIKMHNGLTFIDTPGLINNYQMTSRLTADELKLVIPKRDVVAVTLRVEEGKAVMIGGLATVQLLEVMLSSFLWCYSERSTSRAVHFSSPYLHLAKSLSELPK